MRIASASLLCAFLLVLFAEPASAAAAFVLCPAGNAFADCTKAQCTGPAGGPYSCACVVRKVRSAMAAQSDAANECVVGTSTSVQSRFAPIKYAQLCGPAYQGKHYYPDWAWCMAVMCTRNGKKADCACIAPPAGPTHPYGVIRSTDSYDARQCIKPARVWSSATRAEAQAIQHFMGAPAVVITNAKH